MQCVDHRSDPGLNPAAKRPQEFQGYIVGHLYGVGFLDQGVGRKSGLSKKGPRDDFFAFTHRLRSVPPPAAKIVLVKIYAVTRESVFTRVALTAREKTRYDMITWLDLFHLRSDPLHHTGTFMPEYTGQRHRIILVAAE